MFISLSILCCLHTFSIPILFLSGHLFSFHPRQNVMLDFLYLTVQTTPPAPFMISCRGSGFPAGTEQVVCVRDSMDWTTQYSLSSLWLLGWCLSSPHLVRRAWKIPVCPGILKMEQMNLPARTKASRQEVKTFQLPPPLLGSPPGEVTHS